MIVVMAGRQSPLSRPALKMTVSALLWLTMLATAGCDAPSTQQRASAPLPPFGEARVEKLKTDMTPEEMRELALPVSETPGLSVDKTAAQDGAVGNYGYETGMNPSRGLNTQRLFATAASNDDERMERLETAVQTLRDDFDKVSPAINRLIAIEQEIQTLVDQLQVLVEGENPSLDTSSIPPVSEQALTDTAITPDAASAASPTIDPPPPPSAPMGLIPETQPISPPPAPAPMPPTPPVPAPAAAVMPAVSGEGLRNVRIADHDAKTRIVLETSANIAYTADIDPEGILIVSLASGSSSVDAAAIKPKSALVGSVDITPQNGGGMIIAMPLSKSSRILGKGVLQPDGQNANYRIYIDLAR